MDLICSISHDLYGKISPQLCALLYDAAGLYQGLWPAYEACEVEYHNFGHALDVALATARMTAGWNKSHPDTPIPEALFLLGMAAVSGKDSTLPWNSFIFQL